MTTTLLIIQIAVLLIGLLTLAFFAGSIVERGSFTRQVCKAAEDLRKAKTDMEKKETKKEECCDKEEGCGS